MPRFGPFDLVVVVLYFAILFGISWWSARFKKKESADYFLASRDVGWLAIGASLFASNIGSEHLVGLAGTGAASGLAVGHFEWLASFVLLLLGWLFVPFYLRSGKSLAQIGQVVKIPSSGTWGDGSRSLHAHPDEIGLGGQARTPDIDVVTAGCQVLTRGKAQGNIG